MKKFILFSAAFILLSAGVSLSCESPVPIVTPSPSETPILLNQL